MREHSPEVAYHCGNDCVQSGCPGHRLKIEYHHTSNTTAVLVDGERHATFDDDAWDALLEAQRMREVELGKRARSPADDHIDALQETIKQHAKRIESVYGLVCADAAGA